MEVQYHFRIASVHNIESTRNILAWVNCVLVEQLLVILNQLNWYYCAIAHKNTLHRIHYLIYTSVFREASPYQKRSFFLNIVNLMPFFLLQNDQQRTC